MCVNGRSRTLAARSPAGSMSQSRSRPSARPEGGEPEHPVGAGELGRDPVRQRRQPRPVPAVEPDPLAGLRRDDERPVRRPARLGRPGGRVTGHDPRRARPAVRSDRGHDTLRPVPGQVRVVPAEPREPRPVGREPRRRDEVAAGDEDVHRERVFCRRAVERDRDQRVGRLAGARVILAHGQDPAPPMVQLQVCEPEWTNRGERGRRPVRRHSEQAAGGEVGDDDNVVHREEGPAAVFVDASPDVDAPRADVPGRAARAEPHQRRPAPVLRPALEPHQVVPVPAHLGQPHEPRDDRLGRDRGAPAPVRRDRAASHVVRPRFRSLLLTFRRARRRHTPSARRSCRRCGCPGPRA
jgi:hypothetical protein